MLAFYQPRDGWKLFALRLLLANTVLAIWLWFGAGDVNIFGLRKIRYGVHAASCILVNYCSRVIFYLTLVDWHQTTTLTYSCSHFIRKRSSDETFYVSINQQIMELMTHHPTLVAWGSPLGSSLCSFS